MPTFTFKQHLKRRAFLRASGITIALPWLEAMLPALTRAAAAEAPRRFVSVSNDLGFHAPFLFPEQAGRDYELPRYLQPLADLKNQFTVISGTSHPGVSRGHSADVCILTAKPNISGSNFRNGISLDQLMAKHLGTQTRFRSLALNASGDMSTSFTELGAMIPPTTSAGHLFRRLFVEESPQAQKETLLRMKEGRSILDLVSADAKAMQQRVGSADKDKLDAFFTSVRELEKNLSSDQEWVNRPKPKVPAEPPKPITDRNDIVAVQTQMYDVLLLALQTDSTRFATLHTGGGAGKIPLQGVEEAYHSLSHHGLDPNKITQLAIVEEAQMSAWGEFLRKLQRVREGEQTLLDRTMVLITSNLGNASAHDTKNMPVVFAGGGFRHGQHLAFDRKNNYPLPNLFVSMLQRMGLPLDKFVTGTSTMRGLEMV
ncbi:MAG: hypothetical protein RLZZ142_335 [Verrucomicrobiota bacterium]|jgi:hypothetical protein